MFKKGDMIKCIQPMSYLVYGETYEVFGIDDDYFVQISHGGKIDEWNPDRFVPLDEYVDPQEHIYELKEKICHLELAFKQIANASSLEEAKRIASIILETACYE